MVITSIPTYAYHQSSSGAINLLARHFMIDRPSTLCSGPLDSFHKKL